MSNQVAVAQPNATVVQEPKKSSYRDIQIAETNSGGGGLLLPRDFGEVVAFAELMSKADIAVRKHFRGNAGACMAVTLQAMRWGMDPFAVANKTYFVNDQLAYEAQLVAAVVITTAPIARRPDYEFIGEGAGLKCIVTVEMLDGSTKKYESPLLGAIKTKNSPLWVADPQQQLGYFSIRSWARRHTPDVIMGVYTPDELESSPRLVSEAPARSRLAEKLSGAPKGQNGFSEGFVAREIDGGEVITNEPAPDAGGEPVSAKPTPTGGDGAGTAEASHTASAADPEPVSEWFAKGAEAARAGMSRKALPPELRSPDRADDAAEWFSGYDSVKHGGAA
jgi:hypothetical protein